MTILKPFLLLPFKPQNYRITEGWEYSPEELKITGLKGGHGGIDYELPRGTEVLAAADGWAISSYFSYPLVKDGQPVLYQGKQVWFGLGYFVQIFHGENGFFTAYGHLERIAPDIKFHFPRRTGDKFWPVGHKVSPLRLSDYSLSKWVKSGEVIGYVGDSGLGWGYSDFPTRPDPKQYPSWDEVHLHFEVFQRIGSKGKKKYFDPYGIKGEAMDYPDSVKESLKLGKKSQVLWLRR